AGATSSEDITINPSTRGIDMVGTATGSTFPPSLVINTHVPVQPDPFAGTPTPKNLKSYNGIDDLPVNPGQIPGTSNTAPEGIYTSVFSNVQICHGVYILKNGLGGDVSRDTDPTHIDPNTGTPCDGKAFIFNTLTNFPSSGGT